MTWQMDSKWRMAGLERKQSGWVFVWARLDPSGRERYVAEFHLRCPFYVRNWYDAYDTPEMAVEAVQS